MKDTHPNSPRRNLYSESLITTATIISLVPRLPNLGMLLQSCPNFHTRSEEYPQNGGRLGKTLMSLTGATLSSSGSGSVGMPLTAAACGITGEGGGWCSTISSSFFSSPSPSPSSSSPVSSTTASGDGVVAVVSSSSSKCSCCS